MAKVNSSIGARVERIEDKRFITGNGRYTDDIRLPGQTHAWFVRSPHAHARITSVDGTDSLAMEGVVAVFSGADLAADGLGGLICGWMVKSKDDSPMKVGAHPALAVDRVRYVGDAVAVVIAESREQARLGAEAVNVSYEELPAVVEAAHSLDKNAPQVHDDVPNNHCFAWELGNKAETDAAFAAAAHVTQIDLVNNRLIPNAVEPRAALGDYNPGSGDYTLYTTSQNPHVERLVLSAFVGIAPENKLRVVSPDVGGGFGSKIFVYAEETVCLWAAGKLKRPVKWTAERSESFLSDAHGRDHITHAEMALDGEGKFLALRAHTVANFGAYLSTFASSVPTYLYGTLLSGQYDIPAIHVEVDGVYTHTTPVDAYRGAGRPEATFVVERLVERAARETGLDPAQLRRINFITSFPHQTPVILNYDAGDYRACLERAVEMIDYDSFAERLQESKSRGKRRGVGFSTYIEACGLAPSAAAGSLGAGVGLWESAEVRVNPTGNVEVLTGSHSHGQGHETTFAQLASGRLGIPIDQISIIHGDTASVQFGMGTYGSRSAAVGMSAISRALDKVIEKATRIAAHLMESTPEDVNLEDGVFSVLGTNKSMPWGEVALAAYTAHHFPSDQIEPGLKETVFHDPPNFTFPAGCHICELEIDPETGSVTILDYVAVDDFGTIINPMIVEGQVHGGVVQGIGQALLEQGVYDPETGQLLTGSYMDYCMPRAADAPNLRLDFTKTECPSNPLGVKGCGEAGAIAAPAAVINALTNALGHEDIAMPATPARVWRALQVSSTQTAE